MSTPADIEIRYFENSPGDEWVSLPDVLFYLAVTGNNHVAVNLCRHLDAQEQSETP